jgi:Na+/melibiose symporter-like transporter
MALGGSFAAIVLSFSGYVANTELTESAQTAIIWLFNIVPAGFSLACMIALMFYRLDGDKFSQVLKDLEARAAAKNAPGA